MGVAYTTFQDILDDVLFRASEIEAGSEYEDPAKRYILRGYASILYGESDLTQAGALLDWWWLRKAGALSVANPGVDAGGDSAEGIYDLPDDCESIRSPFFTSRGEPIGPTSQPDLELRREAQRRLGRLDETPSLFAIIRDNSSDSDFSRRVWFDRNGPLGEVIGLRYTYFKSVSAETWEGATRPEMPYKYRKMLADYALYFIYLDKNDDRANALAQLVNRTFSKLIRKETRSAAPDSPLFGRLISTAQATSINVRVSAYSGVDIRDSFIR